MLWDEFLNSDYHDWRGGGKSEDRLDKPEWLAAWLARHNLPDPGAPSPAETAALKRLREAMLRMVQSLAQGRSVSPEDVAELNRTLAEGPFNWQVAIEDAGFRLASVPVRSDWAGIRAKIAASFARMLAEDDPSRLRICDNPDCLWVYYDETKNRSKKYCDDKLCGNLMKVRRFRAKRKASEGAGERR